MSASAALRRNPWRPAGSTSGSAFHRPVEVGPLWIGPPWERPAAGLEPVVIDPGRAFGTGAHPTTRLCVELLLELERGSVLDIGCGSGVLAIAAGKLGFGPVFAVDSDPAGVEAAMRNAEANGVELEVRLLDATAEGMPTAEIALANLDLPTLAQLSRASVAHARHIRLLRERPSGLRRLRPRGSQNRGRLGRRSVPTAVASACRWQRSRSASSAARCRTRMRMQSARHSFAMAMPRKMRPRSRSSTHAV